jgi:hypothetical protein
LNGYVPILLLIALPAFAAPRDVRRVLAENQFLPNAKLEGPVIGYPEPTMISWAHGDQEKPIFISEFDPLPNISTTLPTKQAQQLATILADRQTYNASLGGKLCGGFHADVAIRIPGDTGGIYILLCFTCNQIRLQQHGVSIAFADMDRGRNRLLTFLRSTFPTNKRFKKLPLSKRQELERNWTMEVLECAQTIIPADPLLKHLLTLDPKDVPEDDLEELDIRCTAQANKRDEEEAAQRKKEEQKGIQK